MVILGSSYSDINLMTQEYFNLVRNPIYIEELPVSIVLKPEY